MKLNIQVTQKNIDESRREQKCACPIALAIKDELVASHGAKMHLCEASVDAEGGRCAVEYNRNQQSFDLPDKAIRFIVSRDAKEAVAPFQFSVETRPHRPESQLTIMRRWHGLSID